jgi:hypothetical protein
MASTEESVQNVVGSNGDAANRTLGTAWKSVANGYHAARRSTTQAYGAVKQYANKAYESSREYVKSGGDFAERMGNNLNKIAREQPVIAMVTVFAVGYAATYLGGRIFTKKTPPTKGWRSGWRR